jgi:hypothetical protein
VRLSTFSLSLEKKEEKASIPCPALWKDAWNECSDWKIFSFSEQFFHKNKKNSHYKSGKPRLVCLEASTSQAHRARKRFPRRIPVNKQEAYFPCSLLSVFIVAVGKKCFMESRLIRQMSVVN